MRTHFVPEIEESHLSQSVPMEASTRRERFERKKTPSAEILILQKSPSTVRRSCDFLERRKVNCLYDDYGVKTHFVPQIEESELSQSVPMGASTIKECFERKQFHTPRAQFCDNPLQMSGDPMIIWRFGNLIACTMTMGAKHTSCPKLKNQTTHKVCPWKRQLARSVLRENNSIHQGPNFAIIPFKCPEIL